MENFDVNSVSAFILCCLLAAAIVGPFMFEQRGYESQSDETWRSHYDEQEWED